MTLEGIRIALSALRENKLRTFLTLLGNIVGTMAVIAVVYVAFAGGSSPAALLGVALGLAGSPWTAEPLGQQAFLLGTLGWIAGRASRSLYRDRILTRMAVVGASVLVLRIATFTVTEISLSRARGVGGIHGFDTSAVLQASLLAALGSAVAAPMVFALLRSTRLLRHLETRRRFRFV